MEPWILIQGIGFGLIPVLLLMQIPQYHLNKRKAALEETLHAIQAQSKALDETAPT